MSSSARYIIKRWLAPAIRTIPRVIPIRRALYSPVPMLLAFNSELWREKSCTTNADRRITSLKYLEKSSTAII